jgi:D-aminopeptidase
MEHNIRQRPAKPYSLPRRKRARGLGIPFKGRPGQWNLITDVPGVEVGLVTLVAGRGGLRPGRGPVRTGVTTVLPRGHANALLPCAAAMFSLNGNGEMTSAHWIAESGALHTPIAISNTHAVGACHRGIVEWMLARNADAEIAWVLPVVAETFDGYLNDINGRHITVEQVVEGLEGARSGPFALGSVGGGTGMNAYDFKGGTGSASRLVDLGGTTYTVGVLVQANQGSREELMIAGINVGAAMSDDNPLADAPRTPPGSGSIIAIVATDAPLLPQQCAALARRVPLGLARTGTTSSHFSGDVFLAFSTANLGALRSIATDQSLADRGGVDHLDFVEWGRVDPFLAATVEAVEEAIIDAMVCSRTMVGRDNHRSPGLPLERVMELLREAGRLQEPPSVSPRGTG